MGVSLDATPGYLWVDGERYELTPRQTHVAKALLTGNVVTWTGFNESAQLKVYIQQLRRKTPLQIKTLWGRGYILETDMTDHSKTRPVVDQALGNLKGALKGAKNTEQIRDFTLNPQTYDEKTGTGHLTGKGTTADGKYQVDITVTPESKETN